MCSNVIIVGASRPRVDHNSKSEQLERIGRENESIALARAITYHVEHRVFLDGNKTVVFLGG